MAGCALVLASGSLWFCAGSTYTGTQQMLDVSAIAVLSFVLLLYLIWWVRKRRSMKFSSMQITMGTITTFLLILLWVLAMLDFFRCGDNNTRAICLLVFGSFATLCVLMNVSMLSVGNIVKRTVRGTADLATGLTGGVMGGPKARMAAVNPDGW